MLNCYQRTAQVGFGPNGGLTDALVVTSRIGVQALSVPMLSTFMLPRIGPGVEKADSLNVLVNLVQKS